MHDFVVYPAVMTKSDELPSYRFFYLDSDNMSMEFSKCGINFSRTPFLCFGIAKEDKALMIDWDSSSLFLPVFTVCGMMYISDGPRIVPYYAINQDISEAWGDICEPEYGIKGAGINEHSFMNGPSLVYTVGKILNRLRSVVELNCLSEKDFRSVIKVAEEMHGAAVSRPVNNELEIKRS